MGALLLCRHRHSHSEVMELPQHSEGPACCPRQRYTNSGGPGRWCGQRRVHAALPPVGPSELFDIICLQLTSITSLARCLHTQSGGIHSVLGAACVCPSAVLGRCVLYLFRCHCFQEAAAKDNWPCISSAEGCLQREQGELYMYCIARRPSASSNKIRRCYRGEVT